MNPIAIYSGSTVLYWSSVIIVFGLLASLVLSLSLQRVNGGGSGKTSESAENGNHVFSHFQLPTSRDVFGVRFLFRTGRSMKVGFDSAVNLL